jgi:lysophospholipase L1-like esterase
MGKKKPGERRVIVIGGSTAFGYGLRWNESFPYYLEQKLKVREPRTPVSVVNLGIPTDSARTFVATLNDYAYLDYDVAVFYEGYNDLGLDVNPPKNMTNPAVSHYLAWRHQSPVFRWTGYFPIFPLVLSEKAMVLLHGDLNAAYDNDIVFRPSLTTRTTAAALKSVADIGVAIERRFGQLTKTTSVVSGVNEEGCGRWTQYCGAVYDAVLHTVATGKNAIVVTQPYISDLHIDQQTALARMLARRFPGEPHVRYLNLGRAVNMKDTSLVYDGIHLVARGNELVAEALVPVVLDLIHNQ